MKSMDNSRQAEAEMLDRCATVALGNVSGVMVTEAEANVFHLAASAIRSQFPAEALRLREASAMYFVEHPERLADLSTVLANGWILGLPRLRDMLFRKLMEHHADQSSFPH